jgi:hypothetical protein
MVYYSFRRRVRQQPLRWVLAILLSATLLLLCSPHPPDPMMHGSAHRMHKSWWDSHLPPGNGWFRGPPHHGHDHHDVEAWTEQTWRLSVPELQAFVAGTEGYYVRDWSVGLGWNNVNTTG